MKIGQLIVTLFRNQVYVLLLIHWQSCWWYWLARVHYFSTNVDSPTWFITAPTLTVTNATIVDDYIASFYFMAISFGTVGYGDIHPTSRQVHDVLRTVYTEGISVAPSHLLLPASTPLIRCILNSEPQCRVCVHDRHDPHQHGERASRQLGPSLPASTAFRH